MIEGEEEERVDMSDPVLVEKMSQKQAKMVQLGTRGDVYQLLTRSLAPSIWELDDVKKGILCQMFGGTNKKYEEQGLGRFR